MHTKHDKYRSRVDEIQSNLFKVSQVDDGARDFDSIQMTLDKLAEQYEHDEDIGTERYRLYETQALIHYYMNNDEDAIEFAEIAMDARGEKYERMTDLIKRIDSKPNEGSTRSPSALNKPLGPWALIGLSIVCFIIASIWQAGAISVGFFGGAMFSLSLGLFGLVKALFTSSK